MDNLTIQCLKKFNKHIHEQLNLKKRTFRKLWNRISFWTTNLDWLENEQARKTFLLDQCINTATKSIKMDEIISKNQRNSMFLSLKATRCFYLPELFMVATYIMFHSWLCEMWVGKETIVVGIKKE